MEGMACVTSLITIATAIPHMLSRVKDIRARNITERNQDNKQS
jgi:hypothetical protein